MRGFASQSGATETEGSTIARTLHCGLGKLKRFDLLGDDGFVSNDQASELLLTSTITFDAEAPDTVDNVKALCSGRCGFADVGSAVLFKLRGSSTLAAVGWWLWAFSAHSLRLQRDAIFDPFSRTAVRIQIVCRSI